MDFSDADLDLLMLALGQYRPSGRAAEVLGLLGRVHQELARRRVVAQELGPPTGRPALVPIPGGMATYATGAAPCSALPRDDRDLYDP